MGTEIQSYEAQLLALAVAGTEAERPASSNISLKAGQINYGGSPVPGNKLDVIILASTHANLYYSTAYDPDAIVSPVCFAYAEDGRDMKPHTASAKPQAENCKECPQNQWGSKPGSKGKACSNRRILGLIPSTTTAEQVPGAELAILKLPVMSGENFGNYVKLVAATQRVPTLGVVTTVSTKPDPKSQFKVHFDLVSKVDPSLLGPLLDRRAEVLASLETAYEPTEEAAPKRARRY